MSLDDFSAYERSAFWEQMDAAEKIAELNRLLGLPIFDNQSGVQGSELESSPWRAISKEQLEKKVEEYPLELGRIRRFHDLLPAEAKIWLDQHCQMVDEVLWASPDYQIDENHKWVLETYGSGFGRKGDWRHGLGEYAPGDRREPPPSFFDTQGSNGLDSLPRIAAAMDQTISAARERLEPGDRLAIVDIACGAGQLTASLDIANTAVILNDTNQSALTAAQARLLEAVGADKIQTFAGRAQDIKFDGDLQAFLQTHNIKEIVLVSSWGMSYFSPEEQLAVLEKWQEIATQAGVKITIAINCLTKEALQATDVMATEGRKLLQAKLKSSLRHRRWRDASETLRAIISIRGARDEWDTNRRHNLVQLFREMISSVKKEVSGKNPGQVDFGNDLNATQARYAIEEMQAFWESHGFIFSLSEQQEIMFGQSQVYQLCPAGQT